MVRVIVAKDEQKLYDNFAPIMRDTYSRAELLNPLKRSREMFGDISKDEYRNETAAENRLGGVRSAPRLAGT
jgi:hypothetical protein